VQNDIAVIRAWVREAQRCAQKAGKTLMETLADINAGIPLPFRVVRVFSELNIGLKVGGIEQEETERTEILPLLLPLLAPVKSVFRPFVSLVTFC
jgi:hypothetical protein